jgi:TPP-dependent pyruvate/acetoin dehydrogenase alpha subunit
MAEMRSILQVVGTFARGARPSMDEEFLIEALRLMLLSRQYDERVIGLQRQGRFGVYSPGLGQEAAIVGSAMALDPGKDWIVPQYRELMASSTMAIPAR